MTGRTQSLCVGKDSNLFPDSVAVLAPPPLNYGRGNLLTGGTNLLGLRIGYVRIAPE